MTISRLGKQIEELFAALNARRIRFALIGGLALAMHGLLRATGDIDLLLAADNAEQVDRIMESLGYRCLYRSSDAANYLRGRERADFIFARRPIARGLLASAAERETAFGALRLVSPEGLIGFKLQALVNNPRRTQDREDIRALLRAHRATLDEAEIRRYFRLFEREDELDEMLGELH
jgi:hypothetical protein